MPPDLRLRPRRSALAVADAVAELRDGAPLVTLKRLGAARSARPRADLKAQGIGAARRALLEVTRSCRLVSALFF